MGVNNTSSFDKTKIEYELKEIKKELSDQKTRKIDGIDTYLTDNYIIYLLDHFYLKDNL